MKSWHPPAASTWCISLATLFARQPSISHSPRRIAKTHVGFETKKAFTTVVVSHHYSSSLFRSHSFFQSQRTHSSRFLGLATYQLPAFESPSGPPLRLRSQNLSGLFSFGNPYIRVGLAQLSNSIVEFREPLTPDAASLQPRESDRG